MVITKMALPRRTFLRGMGATLALPFLDAMVPAMSAAGQGGAPVRRRFTVGNGANMNDWTPATEGCRLRLLADPEAARAVSRSDGRLHRAGQLPGDGSGRRRRAASTRRAGVHELRPPEADRRRRRAGRHDDRSDHRRADLPRHEAAVAGSVGGPQRRRRRLRPRIRLRLHELDVVEERRRRRCRRRRIRASCSSGCSASGPPPKSAWPAADEDRSILDGVTQEISKLTDGSARATAPSSANISTPFATSSSASRRPSPTTAISRCRIGRSACRETFREYAELMFDLQVLAFQADITRVSSFMMARENINRSYPEIGLPEAHHSMSHHGNNPEKMEGVREAEHLPRRDAGVLPEEAAGDPDGDGNLLDHTVVLYGSGMSDGNVHNNYNVPVVIVGGRDSADQGQPPRDVTRRARRWRI